DIGKSGWWAGVAFLGELAILAATLFTLPLNESMMIMGGYVLVIGVFLIWLGIVPGQADANRFGEPPSPGISFSKPKTSSAPS
ncbi:MAG TPA: hypothetical protein VGH02_03895, partial [Rhizomicrobium sp.]